MEQCEVDVIKLGKATERLMTNPDFQLVILDGMINKMALDTGKTFFGSDEQIDILKAITFIDSRLVLNIEQAKMITQG